MGLLKKWQVEKSNTLELLNNIIEVSGKILKIATYENTTEYSTTATSTTLFNVFNPFNLSVDAAPVLIKVQADQKISTTPYTCFFAVRFSGSGVYSISRTVWQSAVTSTTYTTRTFFIPCFIFSRDTSSQYFTSGRSEAGGVGGLEFYDNGTTRYTAPFIANLKSVTAEFLLGTPSTSATAYVKNIKMVAYYVEV